jgi:hypothetical protein
MVVASCANRRWTQNRGIEVEAALTHQVSDRTCIDPTITSYNSELPLHPDPFSGSFRPQMAR